MTTEQTGAVDFAGKNLTGYGISYAVTSILSALLVILKESNEDVLGLLASLTGNHWISHSLLDVIIFVALGAVLSRREINMSGNTLISTVVGATVLSGLIIAGFFIL